jgi:predicted lactoylglutathione lyase
MTKELPSRPSLDHLKHQARNLQHEHAAGDVAARERVEACLPGQRGRLSLAKAQTVIAREYGVESWPQLKALVERRLDELHRSEASRAAGVPDGVLDAALAAIGRLDRAALAELLRLHPGLIAVQVGREEGSNLLHDACAVKAARLGRSPADVIAIVDLLLGAGLDVNAPFIMAEGGQLRATWFALRGGSLEVVRHILEKGGNPNGCLFAAAYGEGVEAIRLLHRFGADLEEVAHDETPLLHALKSRKLVAMRELVELGADVNHADSNGATPLHYAVRQYHDGDVITFLLAHGASPAALSRKGASPLDLAVRMGRGDIAVLLGAAPGSGAAVAPQATDVHLRPFLGIEEETLDEAAAFYRELGFACPSLQHEHSFAILELGEATLFLSEGSTRETIAGDAVIYRCSREVFAAVRAALEARSIPHGTEAGALTLEDRSGLGLRFAVDEAAREAVAEPWLAVSDLRRAVAFYQELGFELVDDVTVQLGSARLRLRETPAPLVDRRALALWFKCDDFDGTYHRIRARIPIDPPEVAFHGDILFDVSDPDGHALTFYAPATDI